MTDERNENEENFSEKEEQFVEEQVMTEDPPRDEPENFAPDLETREANETLKYSLRPSRDPGYSYRFSFLSVNAGLQKWGEKAKDALNDELKLFVKEEVFEQG